MLNVTTYQRSFVDLRSIPRISYRQFTTVYLNMHYTAYSAILYKFNLQYTNIRVDNIHTYLNCNTFFHIPIVLQQHDSASPYKGAPTQEVNTPI